MQEKFLPLGVQDFETMQTGNGRNWKNKNQNGKNKTILDLHTRMRKRLLLHRLFEGFN